MALSPKGSVSDLGRTYRHAAAAQCRKPAGYLFISLVSAVVTFHSPETEPEASCVPDNTLALHPFHFLF